MILIRLGSKSASQAPVEQQSHPLYQNSVSHGTASSLCSSEPHAQLLLMCGVQAPCNGPDQATEARLLEMVRNGAHALDAYNITPELSKASAVLGRVVQTCFLYFGSYRTINTAK